MPRAVAEKRRSFRGAMSLGLNVHMQSWMMADLHAGMDLSGKYVQGPKVILRKVSAICPEMHGNGRATHIILTIKARLLMAAHGKVRQLNNAGSLAGKDGCFVAVESGASVTSELLPGEAIGLTSTMAAWAYVVCAERICVSWNVQII